MNGPEWAFPIVESLHFMGLALSIGTIAIVDLRLLGLGMRRQTASQLAADLDRWTWSGFAVMLITGPLMFSADAVAYHNNPAFQFKMTCLLVGSPLPFHNPSQSDPAPMSRRSRPGWREACLCCCGLQLWGVDE